MDLSATLPAFSGLVVFVGIEILQRGTISRRAKSLGDMVTQSKPAIDKNGLGEREISEALGRDADRIQLVGTLFTTIAPLVALWPDTGQRTLFTSIFALLLVMTFADVRNAPKQTLPRIKRWMRADPTAKRLRARLGGLVPSWNDAKALTVISLVACLALGLVHDFTSAPVAESHATTTVKGMIAVQSPANSEGVGE